MAGLLLLLGTLLPGCAPDAPDRSTYVSVWVDALEAVVREEATTGDPGIDPLAAPTDQHHTKLAAALASARDGAGISPQAWEAAILTHEAEARDEIRRRAASLVQGWAEVATTPADTVGDVLLQSLTNSFGAGWNPDPALVVRFESTAEALTGKRGEGGRWLAFLELLTSADADAPAKLDVERQAFDEALQGTVRDLLAALPRNEIARALSDRRLSDGMWEYALAKWNALPPVPSKLDGINLELREALRDRVTKQRELALHLSGWAFAGGAEGHSTYVQHTRGTVRTAVVGQLLPLVADTPLRPLLGGDDVVTRVLEDVDKTLEADAQADIGFRMLRLRHGSSAQPGVAAFVRGQIDAARAAVERPVGDLIAIAVEAVTSVPPAVQERFEVRDRALQDGVSLAARARKIPEAEFDYLRLRLQSDPRPRDAFDAALEERRP